MDFLLNFTLFFHLFIMNFLFTSLFYFFITTFSALLSFLFLSIAMYYFIESLKSYTILLHRLFFLAIALISFLYFDTLSFDLFSVGWIIYYIWTSRLLRLGLLWAMLFRARWMYWSAGLFDMWKAGVDRWWPPNPH